MPLTAVPLFNPQGGYATYVLPAAFVLILQQTLLIGVGLLGTTPEGNLGAGRAGTPAAGPIARVVGKGLAYLALEAFILPLYLIALPYFYGLPRLGSVAAILALAVPFVLSVGFLGLVVAAIFSYLVAYCLVNALVAVEVMSHWSSGHDPRPRIFATSMGVLLSVFVLTGGFVRSISRRHLSRIAQMEDEQ